MADLDADTSAVLARLALRALGDIDELADDFLRQLSDIPEYATGAIDSDTLRADAVRSLELILRLIADGEVPGRFASVSADVGTVRAEVGVPLAALLHAVRLDFRVVWQSLRSRAEPEDLTALVAGAFRVWEAVEQHSMGVFTAYQQRVLDTSREQQDEREACFARLLESDGRHPDVLHQAAAVLALAEDGAFVVMASAPEELPGMRAVRDRLSARGVALHGHETPTGGLIVLQLPPAHQVVPDAWVRGARGAISPVVGGLASVPRAARLAELTLRRMPPGPPGIVRTRDLWLSLAAGGLGEFESDLHEDLFGGLNTLAQREASRVLEVVRSYLRTGSIARTARELYCHRNTVLNRLHRFRSVSGRDVTVLPDAATVALALQAKRETDR